MNGLPFENFHHHIENTVHKTKPRGKWHALNAIRSIKRAWDIRELDPEIALFRATVAEEEAASALMLSLKRRGYSNTSLMNWKDHNHKAALQILYNIVVEGFRNRLWPGTQPNIIMESEASDHGFRLEFVLTTKDGEQKKYSLNEPLDFNTNVDGGEDTFAREIQKVLDDNDEQRIEKYIQKWANVRNRLLYATQNGIPELESDVEEDIGSYFRRTFRMLGVFCVVDLGDKQSFVEQAMGIYTKILGKNKGTNNIITG